MKRYFYAGLIIIFLMAFALVGYGAWLNYSDENQIAKRMDSRVVQLTGAKATIRDFQPTIDMDAVRFSSDSMTDAIALVDGRILNCMWERMIRCGRAIRLFHWPMRVFR